jgi:HK97 family phage major capsid protein
MTAPVIPVSSDELNEMLQTKKVMDEVYADPATFKTFLTNYARASNSTAKGDIERIVEERLQAGLASFAKDTMTDIRRPDLGKASARDLLNQRQTGVMYNRNAMGSKLDGEFENLADLFATVHHGADRSEPARRAKLDKMKNALSSTVPSEGGFLIPEEMRAEILSIALETAVMRPRARVIPMSSKTLSLPMNDSTSNVSSNFGGVVAYWTEEGGALTDSSPSFSKVKLDAKKLTAYSDVPNELDDDAAALQAFLSMAFPETMAFAEDFAFLMGDGVGQPLGALNAANTAIVSVTSGAGFTAGQIITMFSRMLPSSLTRAIWVVSPDVLPDLYTVTSGGRPLLLNNDGGTANLNGGLTLSILGRPVVISEKVNAVNTQGDISFFDPGYYLIGDRMAMSAATSPHYKFGNDITSYRLIERVDGRPWLKDAITPKNGGATLSPFVQLASNDRTPA